MIMTIVKIVGLGLTVVCWIWARVVERSHTWNLILIACAPPLQYPITLLGRRFVNKQPEQKRAEWVSIFVHYAMMIALGISIFPAIRMVQRQPAGLLPVPQVVGQALVWLTGLATIMTVLKPRDSRPGSSVRRKVV